GAAAGHQQPQPAHVRGLARHHAGAAGRGARRPPPGHRERDPRAGRRAAHARGRRGRVPGRRGVHARSRSRRRAAAAVLRRMSSFEEVAVPYRPLVVFDFDHTLYDGDSGSHLVLWLIRRHWWRRLAALLAAPVLLPMVAWLPTRRRGISGFLWIATFGTHGRAAMDALIDRYVAANTGEIRRRLLPAALKVLHRH